MSTKSKKGRNPASVDSWLDCIGLYRKNVAYDETCLFRAVSEQLFECQIYHERVRKECIEYGRSHYFEFWDMLEDEDQWFDHLELLEKHMVVCGNIEMQLISHKYNCDIVVYDAVHQKAENITKRNQDRSLTLCLMNEDHYDVVHQKEHIQNAGFCQSIVYNVLYEDVFKIPKVQDIVRGMLYEKEFVSMSFGQVNNNVDVKVKVEKIEKCEDTQAANVAPFPFKVAKALDPTIYRNIEYDSWTEVRRELRLGDWYYGDDNLILGTRCIYNEHDETYECYIQEIIKDQNKCIVYVTKLAEKRTVNYTDLSPENDAKPWPLPYRFSKNLVVTPVQTTPANKTLKLPKKRKDKRRIKSESPAANSDEIDQDIEAFIGAPLQMQNTSGSVCMEETPPETPLSQHNLLVTPEIPSPMTKFMWETPWSNAVSGGSNKYVWSQASATSPSTPNFNIKPMVASAPVTPNVVPYHDSQYPFVYNYHVDNHYNGFYTPWTTNTGDYNQNQYPVEPEEVKENVENYQESMYAESYETPPPKERPTLPFLPPNTQPVEMFSPVIPIPPGTPVIYAPPTEVSEVVMPVPTPYQVYTPPVDVQYVQQSPYYYSPTISTTWYPLGINSQGFIFPPPINQNMQSN